MVKGKKVLFFGVRLSVVPLLYLLKRNALQKAVAILLLFALTMQLSSELGVWAGYEIHKSYIAAVLCVNRDKPAMHCDGKCYLKKKLQQDHQRKDGENGNISNRMDVVLFCSDGPALFIPGLGSSSVVYSRATSYRYPSPYFTFFHPPRVLARVV